MKRILYIIILLLTVSSSCQKEKTVDPNLIVTLTFPISSTQCRAEAKVLEFGKYEIIDYGFCIANSNPFYPIASNCVSLGKKLLADTFSTNLPYANTSYDTAIYVRAYITNKIGTVYSLPKYFKPIALKMISVNPLAARRGDSVTIEGDFFNIVPEKNIVKFNATSAKIISATKTKLVVEVPTGITSDNSNLTVPIYINNGDQTISFNEFTPIPGITSVTPLTGTFQTQVTITTENLVGPDYEFSLKFGDELSGINGRSGNTVIGTVPYSVRTSKFPIKIVRNNMESLPSENFIITPMSVTSISPARGYLHTTFTVTGTNFNPCFNCNGLQFNARYLNLEQSSTTIMQTIIPMDMAAGSYDISVMNMVDTVIRKNGFEIVNPEITGYSSDSCYFGDNLVINGLNLDIANALEFAPEVYFGSTPMWADVTKLELNKISVKVPTLSSFGKTTVLIHYHYFNYTAPIDLLILEPVITSLSPSSGIKESVITIKGKGFGNSTTNVTIKFGMKVSPEITVTPTQIQARVPSDAISGLNFVSLEMGGETFSCGNFTVSN